MFYVVTRLALIKPVRRKICKEIHPDCRVSQVYKLSCAATESLSVYTLEVVCYLSITAQRFDRLKTFRSCSVGVKLTPTLDIGILF